MDFCFFNDAMENIGFTNSYACVVFMLWYVV